jgi:hypothetical protein
MKKYDHFDTKHDHIIFKEKSKNNYMLHKQYNVHKVEMTLT